MSLKGKNSMNERILLVNNQDKVIGQADKLEAHQGKGILHRAFTIFIFSQKGEILIQKRSAQKLLWPLFWETSCSSHPLPGQDILQIAQKRIRTEIGVESGSLKYWESFSIKDNTLKTWQKMNYAGY